MNQSSEFTKQRLLAAGRTKDKAKLLAWTVLISATFLGVLLIASVVDCWLAMSVPLRVGAFMLLVLLLGLGLAGWFKLRIKPTQLKEAALDTEAQRTDLGCLVSTASEYITGERTITREYEPELVDALEDRAARKLKQTKISYRQTFLRPAVLLACALATILIFSAASPVATTAFKRVLTPWTKETYTKVLVQPGNVDIPVGQDLDVTNIFSGRVPKNPTLHWRETNQSVWQSVPLQKSEGGVYIHPFKNLRTDLQYRTTGNDAVSETYEVTTFVPPEIADLRIGVTYPSYTKVKPFEAATPNFSVLRASELGVRVTASTKIAKAHIRFSSTNASALDLTPGPNDQWTGSFKATQDTDYWIELADAKGHTGGNKEAFHLKVLPDKPPKVEITEPGQDISAEATNSVPLKIAAADDYGVSEIKVIYHRLGDPERVLDCAFTNTESGEAIGGVQLPLAGLGLKEYELVAYHAEAKDNNTLDGPGKGSSPVYFIEITNEEGGTGKSKAQGNADRVNLLSIQKQLIADTSALAAKAPKENFEQLASRQKEATEFAQIYKDNLPNIGAPPEAIDLMADALEQMQSATKSLSDSNRDQALPPEEKALADLYQVVKLLPQLANMPTQPPPPGEPPPNPPVQVVLQAIKKQKKEPPSSQELADLLEAVKTLSVSQAGLLQDMERPEAGGENQAAEDNASSTGKGKTGQEGQDAQMAAKEPQDKNGANSGEENKNGNKPEEKGSGKDGQEKGKEAQAANGQGKNSQEQQAGKPGQGKGKTAEELKKMAELQEQLSKEAAAVAEKLQQMAGKDGRLGQGAQRNMAQAAGKMAAAAQALKQGNGSIAGTEGGQGLLSLDKVMAILERFLKNEPKLSDVTAEDFPKEYEALISEYLRKLSHEK